MIGKPLATSEAAHQAISKRVGLVRRRWEILESPYRALLEPLLAYINEIDAVRQPGDKITVVVPQFVSRHWWTNLLHAQTATWPRLALLLRPEIVITDVPYLVVAA